MAKSFWLLLIPFLFVAGCITVPPQPPAPPPPIQRFQALVPISPENFPLFEDDLDTASLRTAALQSRSYFESLPAGQLFVLGTDTYTAKDMAGTMAYLASLIENSTTKGEILAAIHEHFKVYQSVGTDAQRTVVFSSYYEPTISARLSQDTVYRYPLYSRPQDLVDVNVGLFEPAYQGLKVAGRVDGRTLVPYPTRANIDSEHILQGKGLELAWAKDPMDILDLQIEGSGWLDLGITTAPVRVRYDGDNGRKYRSVGQYIISRKIIPAKRFTREAYLRYMEKHPKKRQSLLNVDERYIFFRIDTSSAAAYAYGDIDVPLTPGRSIATDPKLFPKGALAWIDAVTAKRFMFSQDEGGAIQGPGRVDIFAGHGESAKAFATHTWNKGHLYFLVKKK